MRLCLLGGACIMFFSNAIAQHSDTPPPGSNPFLSRYTTPFETPPFDIIREEHFLPAFTKGMEDQKREIDALLANPQPPSFGNTIAALDHSGDLLGRVSSVFGSLRGANTNETLDSIANIVTPLLSAHRNDIALNEKLFQRIKAVRDGSNRSTFSSEQRMLLENTYKDFVRGGANLPPDQRKRFREINAELSMLSLKFGQNVRKETNDFMLVIEKKEDLAGLPQSAVDGAAERATTAGLPGTWVFTLQKPSLLPFLEYAENRALRESIFKAYIFRGDNTNGQNNKPILVRIASLRVERARLLGYPSHAAYVLEENMAKTPSSAYDLLQKLWEPALRVAGRERDAMQELIVKEGGTFKLEPWDWWFYASRVKKAKYDLDENELRPYFRLENVRKGAFDVASKLFGIRFVERTDIPTYQVDVRVFEVKRTDGSHVGILYTDYFPRAGKDPGAWMDSYRQRERLGNTLLTPIVFNVGNFSRPTGDTPSLLSLEEVETLFHEFGHALFGLLSGRNYRNLDLPRDGIELPSQIMENWALTPAVLRAYAFHYKTGEPMPQALIDKISNSKKFNQGFVTVEYLAAAFLDMDWHTLTDPAPVDPTAFEQASLARIHLMPEIVSRYRSPFFSHIFSGDYSAGYYNYIWAEVLDADAFEAFRENGLFDPATAKAFRHFILELGGTDDPMVLYEKFRGKKPAIEPLLRRRGLM